jgi:hypothetical protein
MLNARYSTYLGDVVVTDALSGEVLWSGAIDQVKTDSVLPLGNSDDAIVLLDRMARKGRFPNLLRIDRNGEILWRAELPSSSDPNEAYVSVEVEGDTIRANSWSGYRVRLSADSGRIAESTFTK